MRFRELDEDTIEGLESAANTMAGPPPAGRENEWERAQWVDKLQKSIQRLGANRFTVEVSEHPVDTRNYPSLREVKFQRMTAQLMQTGASGLLKVKDIEALKQLYSQLHHVTYGEVQELMGKAIQVV
jgi:hypothetical protein